MNTRVFLRLCWESLVGLIFVLFGLLCLLLIFWASYLMPAAHPVPDESAVILPDDEDQSELIDNSLPLPTDISSSAHPSDSKLLPMTGIYMIDGSSLDMTVDDIIQREQERIAALKAAEARRRAAEAARRHRIAEAKRKAEAAKRAAEARKKQIEEQKRKEEARRAAEEAQRREEAKKQAEKARRRAIKKKTAAKHHKSETHRRVDKNTRQKIGNAQSKAQRDRELQDRLAKMGVYAPALDGLESATDAYGQEDIKGYSKALNTAVRRFYRLPANTPHNLDAEFLIKINETGAVIDVELRKSSGYPLFDDEARNAIYAASPLPLPTHPKLREDTIAQGILFKFKP